MSAIVQRMQFDHDIGAICPACRELIQSFELRISRNIRSGALTMGKAMELRLKLHGQIFCHDCRLKKIASFKGKVNENSRNVGSG